MSSINFTQSTQRLPKAAKLLVFLYLDQDISKTYSSKDIPRDVGRIHSKIWMPSWMETKDVSWSFSLAGMPETDPGMYCTLILVQDIGYTSARTDDYSVFR